MDGSIRFAGLLAVSFLLAGPLQAQAKARITLTGGPQAGSYEMVGSPVCKTFDDGSFSDSGFTDQDRIVFCTSAEYLDKTFSFRSAADKWIKLSARSELGQVARKFGDTRRFRRLFFYCAENRTVNTSSAEFIPNIIDLKSKLDQYLSRDGALFTKQSYQQMVGADKSILLFAALFAGIKEDLFCLG